MARHLRDPTRPPSQAMPWVGLGPAAAPSHYLYPTKREMMREKLSSKHQLKDELQLCLNSKPEFFLVSLGWMERKKLKHSISFWPLQLKNLPRDTVFKLFPKIQVQLEIK